jgi:hypothetical protein
MSCVIRNPSNIDLTDIKPHVQGMYRHFAKKYGFNKPPVMVFDSDPSNKSDVLGKTAYYDPNTLEIHVYTDGRHPKDMLRSIAHELIHHRQNLEGRLNVGGYQGEGYYLKNEELKKLEQEAMKHGNESLREYEDGLKLKRNEKMSLKEWKNKELNRLLMEKFKLSPGEAEKDMTAAQKKKYEDDINNTEVPEPLEIVEDDKKEYDLEENQDRVFAPSHYCAHHVVHEGKKGVTVDHNWSKSLQRVTKYDVKFEDGTIIRNIEESQLTIVEGKMHGGKRDEDHPEVKNEDMIDNEGADEMLRKTKERNKIVDEAEKPDFPDVDGDGDKEEPISKAQQDKKDAESNNKDKKSDESEEGEEEKSSDGKDLSKVPKQLRKHVAKNMKENLQKKVSKLLKENKKLRLRIKK